MEIGNIIRTKRRAKDMTQEELAEKMSVSISAVSQWECGKSIPDLTMIPALCSVLDVSADELLGVDRAKKHEQIREIIDEADELGCRGYLTEACDILEKGLKRFPESFVLETSLMNSAALLYYRNREKNHRYGERALELGERILLNSKDSGLRANAVQTLIGVYGFFGNFTRQEELLEQTISIWQSREVQSTSVYRGDRGIACTQILLGDLIQLMYAELMGNRQRDNGENWLTEDELAAVHDKLLKINHILYENGDFGFGYWRMCDLEMMQMKYYAEKSDAVNTLFYMKNAAHHAVEFVRLIEKGEFRHTSILFRDKPTGSFSSNDTSNSALILLKRLESQIYDYLRHTDEFREITAELEQYAGRWGKPE